MDPPGDEHAQYNAIQGENKKEKLDLLSREELMDKVRAMELHIRQLRNIIAKSSSTTNGKPDKRKHREFNHDKFRRRHILLRLCYLGWDYQGLASQEDTARTIEAELFRCLQLTRLVRCRQTANYHRCGRTDKGVSAFSQVISLDVRSQQLADPADPTAAATLSPEQEINYPAILNKVLPAEIRALCWSPADPEASARFDCRARTYRYFFPRGDLNIQAMCEAASRLCGHHDFRNLCKMDVGNGVIEYRRRLERVTITPVDGPAAGGGGGGGDGGYQMYQLEVRGNAFLWHQIRCMVAVLFLVGEGLEEPSVIDQLLDVETNPRKPQYNMASELPLNLFDVEYDSVRWHCDPVVLRAVAETLQRLWTQSAVRAAMLREMLTELTARHGEQPSAQTRCLTSGVRPRVYTPLLRRPTCDSLEERVDHYVKRRKLDPAILESAVSVAGGRVLDAASGAVGDGADERDSAEGRPPPAGGETGDGEGERNPTERDGGDGGSGRTAADMECGSDTR
ncbi:tRNA pseudouridine(38/39) synthase-like [Amphibalanus amphitrite]|uniref:tRNA pseudouridine(38/39) synthase-like n=1 Tax=Amphibalanus amphitrite TaxID=1232801 RepID=UPI001C8FD847|nr:tRNA pseudouridine(38/39) synthase-like [Amphibalanus amphitrite]